MTLRSENTKEKQYGYIRSGSADRRNRNIYRKFLLPSGKESGINKEAAKEEIKGLMEEEMQTVRSQMQDKMDETSEDALEKAERSWNV